MSVYIENIRLYNWRCFAGEQTIEGLRPISYSVVAHEATNVDRSNWLGKSSLLEAPRYALVGETRKDESATGWITHGEREGGVDLEFNDGTFVSRNRIGSKGTLQVETPDGLQLNGDAAQEWIYEHLVPKGLINITAFFEQGQTDKLVSMSPTPRSDMVSDWLGLQILEEAAAIPLKAVQAQSRRLDAAEAYVVEHGPSEAAEKALKDAKARLGECAVVFQEAKHNAVQAQSRNAHHAEWGKAVQAANEYRELKSSAPKSRLVPRDKQRARSDEAVSAHATAVAWAKQKKDRVAQARLLVGGEFDGCCPVAQGFECPARSNINAQRTENVSRLEEAREALKDAAKDVSSAQEVMNEARDALGKLDRQLKSREAQKRRLAELEEYLEFAAQPEPPCPDLESVLDELTDATRCQTEANEAVKAAEVVVTRVLEAEEVLDELRDRINIDRAAARVLGRSGAQRELAQSVLDVIAGRANSALERAGVPLQLSVSWGKEGKSLEENCGTCGFFYGKSQRAKECEDCGTKRARKFDGKLTVELANVSGGASDIGGLMLQLAAARWLRDHRTIGLASYFIDEPFGQVDRANRVGIAAKFHSVIHQEFGALQAFVVAHDNDTLETLPGRLVVTSEGGRSTVVVNHGS